MIVSYSFFVIYLLLSCYLLFWFADLCKRGQPIKIVGDILIVDGAVVSGHGQRFMTQERLQRECIAAAVYQIFPGEGMSEQMQTGFLHTAPPIVFRHSRAQSFFCQHFSKLATEQVIRWFTASDRHVVQENVDHNSTQRNGLYSAILCMPEQDLSGAKIHIPDLNVSDCCCPTTAVQKKVYNCPIAEFCEITVCIWLPQQQG